MDLIKTIRKKARLAPKRIVLPEAEEERVKEAAEILRQERIAQPILLDKNMLREKTAPDYERFVQDFYELRRHKGVTLEHARRMLSDPVYFAAMMVREGQADGFVAGASYTTKDVARAAIICIGADPRLKTVSSLFIMIVPGCPYGEGGVFIFADCGIVPQPTSRQLSQIAVSSASFAQEVLGIKPRIAMLSFSTFGSASGAEVDKAREATAMVRKLEPNLIVDGEIQVDAAIVPEVARIKAPASSLKGMANVLIFPDLDAGNIAYKLVHRLASGSRAIGPILQGLNKPASDLSRGCNVEDIVDAVAITVIRAQIVESHLA
jgi:phosphate acetyltransferase